MASGLSKLVVVPPRTIDILGSSCRIGCVLPMMALGKLVRGKLELAGTIVGRRLVLAGSRIPRCKMGRMSLMQQHRRSVLQHKQLLESNEFRLILINLKYDLQNLEAMS